MKKKKLAIIGAGAAGLAAAWRLRDENVDVTVFEKSRGFGGRAASRTRHGVRFDFGANYFKSDGGPVWEMIQSLPTDDLFDIRYDVWTFDQTGKIAPGDPELNREGKWTYNSGISTLGKLLAVASGASVERQVRIGRLEQKEESWELFDAESGDRGEFDAVLLTCPAPQGAELLRESQLDEPLRQNLISGLGSSVYHLQWCFALGWKQLRERPGDFFALVNTDREHPLAWLSFENDKPGRVPEGETALIVQMQPEWSRERFEVHPNLLLPVICEAVDELLGWPEIEPDWTDAHRWRYAHPESAADAAKLESGEESGLFFAGDALVGKGRVHLALESGLQVAERIQARMS